MQTTGKHPELSVTPKILSNRPSPHGTSLGHVRGVVTAYVGELEDVVNLRSCCIMIGLSLELPTDA